MYYNTDFSKIIFIHCQKFCIAPNIAEHVTQFAYEKANCWLIYVGLCTFVLTNNIPFSFNDSAAQVLSQSCKIIKAAKNRVIYLLFSNVWNNIFLENFMK